ncbi:hypothetical protein Ae706Ps2_3548 [Pseudonocardia sp. Ae706_Ps2]|nr:hypothetical protein Ae706Ps2_3548 [Pseudonocardia sp. Ae706_Ps2]
MRLVSWRRAGGWPVLRIARPGVRCSGRRPR